MSLTKTPIDIAPIKIGASEISYHIYTSTRIYWHGSPEDLTIYEGGLRDGTLAIPVLLFLLVSIVWHASNDRHLSRSTVLQSIQ